MSRAGEDGGPTRKVLVPFDFSEHGRRAIVHALGLADGAPAEIYLFHVFEPQRRRFVGKRLADRLDAELDRMEALTVEEVRRLMPEGAEPPENIHFRIGNGRPWEEILRMAANISADVIVLGAHRDGRGPRLGSQAARVVSRAPCTVVCVRDKNADFVMP